jgi:YD repeat-containing protein
VPYSYRDYVYNGSANNVSIKNIHGYTTKGGIRSFSQNDGVKTTYIWGFGDFYPTAEVLNADSLDVAYTGFSKGEGGGGWSSYNEGYVNDELPNSADGVYDFFGPSPRPLIKKDLTATKNYELSYLSKPDNSIIVTTDNGRIAPVSISGNNEWQLMKYKISNATFVRVEGHGEIDNLRIHPVDAVMTTLTYLPLVGVTSSTDAKGKTVFYEYDSFFRLKNIKDQRGNILENYEYHFKP